LALKRGESKHPTRSEWEKTTPAEDDDVALSLAGRRHQLSSCMGLTVILVGLRTDNTYSHLSQTLPWYDSKFVLSAIIRRVPKSSIRGKSYRRNVSLDSLPPRSFSRYTSTLSIPSFPKSPGRPMSSSTIPRLLLQPPICSLSTRPILQMIFS